jgi:glycosyltransferase involved in cell wall biosynthesis
MSEIFFSNVSVQDTKVSVIVTCYNYGRFLLRCLRSLVFQNINPITYEIIIVDDLSTDNTRDVALNFIEFHGKNYPRITYIRNDTNLGVAASSNVGIANSCGRYFVRVDADDYVNKNMLFIMSEYLDHNPSILGVSCDYIHVNDDEQKIERFFAAEHPISCGIMYQTELLKKYGLYNEDWRHREEEELRKRLGTSYNIDHLRIPFYRYRMHSSNKTKSEVDMKYFKSLLSSVIPKE